MSRQPRDINLEFMRALDGILLGSGILGAIIILQMWFPVTSRFFIRYIYLIPVFIIMRASFAIPAEKYQADKWIKVTGRFRFFAFALLALSPFWGWWSNSPENSYLQINCMLLLLVAMLYVYNFVSLAVIAGKESDLKAFEIFARITRIAIIYMMIAPLIALFFSITYTRSSSWALIVFLIAHKTLIISIGTIPLFMAIFILLRWRHQTS